MATPKRKKNPDRQRTSRGSSFLRIAKDLRIEAKELRKAWRKTRVDDTEANNMKAGAEFLELVADANEREAKRLRAMR